MSLPMASSTLRSNAPCPFQSALLLTDEEHKVFADRTALRNAGVRHFRVITSGVEAAQYLAERVSTIIYPVTEIIVCLPELTDMDQAEFAALVRSHPLLPHMPLLAIISHRNNEAALRKAGYNAVLPRPFNTNTLCAVLNTVSETSRQTRATLIDTLKRNRAIPGHDQFNALLQRYIPPDKERMTSAECYQYGKQLLKAQHLDLALPYLQKATTDPAIKAEACLALAVLWRDKRDYDKVKICLFSALKAFMDASAWPQALTLTKKLVAEYPAMPHPLLHELERRVRQKKVADAIAMLPHVQGSLPQGDIAQTLLRGTHATAEPEHTLAEMLDLMGQSERPDILALREELARLLPGDAPVKKHWLKRLLSRDDNEDVVVSTAGNEPRNTLAITPKERRYGVPLAESFDQSLLSIPTSFSLVDDEAESTPQVLTSARKLDEKDLAEITPPPLILSVPENFAKTAPLRDDEKRIPLREKSSVNPNDNAPVLSLLGDEEVPPANRLRPSLLGDVWTMVRGTMRLYRSSK